MSILDTKKMSKTSSSSSSGIGVLGLLGVVKLKTEGFTVIARGGNVSLADVSKLIPLKREALFIAQA